MPPKGTTGMAERDFFIKNLFLLAYVHFFSYLCTIFHIMRNYVQKETENSTDALILEKKQR